MIPANPNDVTAADMQKLFGKVVLFIGVEAQHWTLNTFRAAAGLAKALGVDTICPKRADGSIRWYESPAQIEAERSICLAEGVGYVPFLYAYGPKFGDQQIHDECAVLVELAKANAGSVVCDMETEWDNEPGAAALFDEIMRPEPCILGITTWADPAYMGWEGVLAALAPCCNVWIPQRYDNWLNSQHLPPEATIIQAGIDLSQEFGSNNVLAIVRGIAARGGSAWVWEYGYANQMQSFMRSLAAVLHGSHVNDVIDVPEPGFTSAYVTTEADTSIAQVGAKLGLDNPQEQLYKPNMGAIEDAARAYGHPGSSNGQHLMPGVKLNYR